MYRFDDSFEFSCGGNRWYGIWRNALARLTGLKSQTVLATDPNRYAEHPFFELLYFADNVGTLDQKACEALRLDFEQYDVAMSRGAKALATAAIETMRGEISFGYPMWKMDGVTPIGVAEDFIANYANFKQAVMLAAKQNRGPKLFIRISSECLRQGDAYG